MIGKFTGYIKRRIRKTLLQNVYRRLIILENRTQYMKDIKFGPLSTKPILHS